MSEMSEQARGVVITRRGVPIKLSEEVRKKITQAYRIQKERDPRGRWSVSKMLSRAMNLYGAKGRTPEEALNMFLAAEYNL